MSDVLNAVQNTSYTNKDFQSIWPELLDLVSQMTSTWDPSLSNESDPGVILLKLDALIADKLNYSIDKNTLECFPLSVTQDKNARQMYAQLGYNMKWYQAARTQVTVKWKSTAQSDIYVQIPEFTMVSNDDGTVVYALLGPYVSKSTMSINYQNLPLDGTAIVFDALQGIPVTYDINGDTNITVAHLDSNNRIYFNTKNVAQNGIFICNTDQRNWSTWEQKDNLLVESLGNNYFQFGVSQDSDTCYIEFPEDAESIFKDGITITYIQTLGSEGNVPAQSLTKFYSDVTLTSNSGSTVVLSQDNTTIVNASSGAGGEDTESLVDAYTNFKKTVGTFDTLVTLRDYLNYVTREGLASNGIVSDRTCDPQCCYQVIANVDGNPSTQTNVDTVEDNAKTPSGGTVTIARAGLTAFDIKAYLFKPVEDFTTATGYSTSYSLMNNNTKETVESYIDDVKLISHDIASIVEPTTTRSNICLLLNEYPLTCRIVTKFQITDEQAVELASNVRKALFAGLNSQVIDFSEDVTIETVSDIVLAADTRIKSVSVDNIEYTTYAVYAVADSTGSDIVFKTAPVSSDVSYDPVSITITYNESYMFNEGAYGEGAFCLHKASDGLHRYRAKKSMASGTAWSSSNWDQCDVLFTITDYDGTYIKKLGYNTYPTLEAFYRDGSWKAYNGNEQITPSDLSLSIVCEDTSITTDTYTCYSGTYEDSSGEEIEAGITFRTSYSQQFADEIYTKSVLCGVTPLFSKDEPTEYTFNQFNGWKTYQYPQTPSTGESVQYIVYRVEDGEETKEIGSELNSAYIEDNSELTSNVDIEFCYPEKTVLRHDITNEYTLRNNESLQIYYPNLIDSVSYSSYVKFDYQLNNAVSVDEEYELSDGEYIMFYWKAEGNDSDVYSYYAYSTKAIIKPNIALSAKTLSFTASNNLLTQYGSWRTVDGVSVKDSATNGYLSSTDNSEISNVTDRDNILSGSKEIILRKINSVDLNSTYRCYWITSEVNSNDEYVLSFEEYTSGTKTSYERLLNSGEYFMYSDAALSNLTILGTGSKIICNNPEISGTSWSVPKVDLDDIYTKGTSAFSLSDWKQIDAASTITLVENKYIALSAGTSIRLTAKDSSITWWDVIFSRQGCAITSSAPSTNPLTLSGMKIEYKTATETTYTSLDIVNIYSIANSLDGLSSLSITLGQDIEQVLYWNQSIDLTSSSGVITRIKGKDLDLISTDTSSPYYNRSYYPIELLSDTTINFDGKGIKYLSYLDSNDDTVYPKIYISSSAISKSDGTIRYSSLGDVVFTFPATTTSPTTYKIKFTAPVGNYIIKYTNSSKETSVTPSILLDGTALTTMYGKALAKESSTFLLMSLTGSDITVHEISVVITGTHSSSAVISLENPYKFVKIDGMTDSFYEKIREMVQIFDTNKVFDYTYEVESDHKISDPLSARSFLSQYHPYYSYTICKLDTSSNAGSIEILNKK